MKYACSILFLALCLNVSAQTSEFRIEGQVLDQKDQTPIPFASVALESSGKGVITDIDGRYELSLPSDYSGSIIFRHVSYQSRSVQLMDALGSSIIYLEKKTTQLENLVFEAGENPANPIIRQVIKNRKRHNPSKLDAYKYKTYSREVYRFEMEGAKGDSIRNLILSKNPGVWTRQDSAFMDFEKSMNQYHLMISESVAEVKHISPGIQNETVLASNISGFEGNLFAATGSGYQPFGFYESMIPLFDKEFVNPINPAGLQQYDFYIEDTTFFDRDTVFVISFEPKKNRKFEALYGFLYVHGEDYALTNVVAENRDRLAKTSFKIQQVYDKVEGTWFPVQLNTDVTFREYEFYGRPLLIQNKRYLVDIDLDPQLSLKDFSDVLVDIQRTNKKENDELLNRSRVVELDSLESNTFIRLDSLAADLRAIEKLFEILITQRIEVGKVDLRLKDFVGFNRYEKLRLGVGMETNDHFSKKLRLGGYGAYGFGDKSWKYGGDLRWEFDRRTSTNLLFTYKDDIREVGHVQFFEESVPKFADILRVWQGNLFDRQERYGAFFNTRLAPFFYGQLGWATSREYTTYDYAFSDGEINSNEYSWNEASLTLRYTHKEQYFDLYGRKLQLSHDYPSINAKYAYGSSNWVGGDFDYWRVDLSFEYRKKYRLGVSRVNILGGYIEGSVPYSRLLTGWGNGPSNWSVPNYFQTMGLYEFVSSRAVGLMFNHNFGNILYASRISKPEFLLYHNMAIGDMDAPEQHQNVTFATMERGYLESGVGLKNLLRLNYANIAYWGMGMEVFYRYGEYALTQQKDNFFCKFSLNLHF